MEGANYYDFFPEDSRIIRNWYIDITILKYKFIKNCFQTIFVRGWRRWLSPFSKMKATCRNFPNVLLMVGFHQVDVDQQY